MIRHLPVGLFLLSAITSSACAEEVLSIRIEVTVEKPNESLELQFCRAELERVDMTLAAVSKRAFLLKTKQAVPDAAGGQELKKLLTILKAEEAALQAKVKAVREKFKQLYKEQMGSDPFAVEPWGSTMWRMNVKLSVSRPRP